jgi:hypothetical protein
MEHYDKELFLENVSSKSPLYKSSLFPATVIDSYFYFGFMEVVF